MMKKLCSLSLAAIMVIGMGMSAYAAEPADAAGFKEAETMYVGVESQTLEIGATPNGALPARPEDVISASALPDKASDDTAGQREGGAEWIYLPEPFVVYNQMTNVNCGPACLQAVLKYITGSTPEQSEVALACNTTAANGTYLSDMTTYINEIQNEYTYFPQYNSTSMAMNGDLNYIITRTKMPSIVGVSFSSNDGWLYSSGGHFVSVYGIMSDMSEYALGDPWIGYTGSGLTDQSWSYPKSSADLYRAYSNKNLGYMY